MDPIDNTDAGNTQADDTVLTKAWDKPQGAVHKVWDNPQAAAIYKVSEQVTGEFAKDLLKAIDFGSGPNTILDQGCGAGVIGARIFEDPGLRAMAETAGSQIVMTDVTPSMVEATKQRIEAGGWKNSTAQIADIQVRKRITRSPKAFILC
jgi:ubiquinone/menaquinone biosynthesis C-methylase UbiE